MSDRRSEIMDALRELAELTTLDEGSPQSFRVRAYENAMRAVESASGDIGALSEAQLAKLKGIGKSTAQKIRELLDTGRMAKLEGLREKYPPAFVELSRVPGLGPKAVAKLRSELGVQNVDDLRQALADQKIRGLSGFGAKSEEKIARSLERLGLTGKQRRTPIHIAMPIAQRIVEELASLPEVEHVEYCGSLRRLLETIGDIDIVVASRHAAPIMERFVGLGGVSEVLVRGDTKTSVLFQKGMQVDLRVVEPGQLGAALCYFTGSKAHNIKLRQRAIDRGWLLNEYGLIDNASGKVIAAETEQEIYKALDLPYVPPPMREDQGEVELAARGALPRALAMSDMLGDLHVHTELSGDGRSPLEAMVERARARGYTYLAITEHAEDLPMNGVSREGLLEQRERMRALQAETPDLRLLHGVELNIGPDGGLDYDADFRMGFDWCIAAVHSHYDLSVAQQTDRLVKAMHDPAVNVIGHISGRMIGRRPGIELDVDTVLHALVETGTALELNAALPRLDATVPVLRRAQELGVDLVISSDAHHHGEYGRMRWGTLQAQRALLDPDRVANTWAQERFVSWAGRKRARA